MPVINIALQKLDDRTKTDLIRKMTATAADSTGIPAEKFIVYIDEFDDANIGIGGRTLVEVKAAR